MPKAPKRPAIKRQHHTCSFRSGLCLAAASRIPNRRSSLREGPTPWPRVHRSQRARSTLPSCDTPDVASIPRVDCRRPLRARRRGRLAVRHALDRRYAARPDLAGRRPHLPGPHGPAAARRSSGPAVHGGGLRSRHRLPAACWRSTCDPGPRPTSTTRPPSSASCSIGWTPGTSPTSSPSRRPPCARPVRRRCPGGNCATSPARCRCGSP